MTVNSEADIAAIRWQTVMLDKPVPQVSCDQKVRPKVSP